jgi:DNA-directed RNA polymerase subunit RPC12/RpoP
VVARRIPLGGDLMAKCSGCGAYMFNRSGLYKACPHCGSPLIKVVPRYQRLKFEAEVAPRKPRFSGGCD